MKKTFNGYQRVLYTAILPEDIPLEKSAVAPRHMVVEGNTVRIVEVNPSDFSDDNAAKRALMLKKDIGMFFEVPEDDIKIYTRRGYARPTYDFSMKSAGMIQDYPTTWVNGMRLRPYSTKEKSGVLVSEVGNRTPAEVLKMVSSLCVDHFGLFEESIHTEPWSEKGVVLISDYKKGAKMPDPLKLGDTVWCVSKIEDKKTKALNAYVAEKQVRVMELLEDGNILYTAGKRKELVFKGIPGGGFEAEGFQKPVYTDKSKAEEQAAKGEY